MDKKFIFLTLVIIITTALTIFHPQKTVTSTLKSNLSQTQTVTVVKTNIATAEEKALNFDPTATPKPTQNQPLHATITAQPSS